MIELGDKIATGSERDVYILPDNDSLLVKINRSETATDINKVEYDHYLSRIADTELAPYFPRIVGWRVTPRGKGLVVECVLDHDGRISRNLAEAIEENTVDYSDVRPMLDGVAHAAVKHGLLMRELDAVNILIRFKNDRNEFDIVIVDGYGLIPKGLKTKLRLKIVLLARMKARKSWKKQIAFLDAWADRTADTGK